MDYTPFILSVFSNPLKGKDGYLPYLEEEREKLQKLADDALAKKPPVLYKSLKDEVAENVTLDKIAETLYQFKHLCNIIHFSGHAGGSLLSLRDDDLRADNFIRFLSDCEQLKLVVLNGCSTEGFVKKVLERTKAVAVIATTNQVDDKNAMKFSEIFYKNIFDKNSLGKSFTHALSIALPKSYKEDSFIYQVNITTKNGSAVIESGNLIADEKKNGTRAILNNKAAILKKNNEAATWGLYTKHDDVLDWTIFESSTETDKRAEDIKDQLQALEKEFLELKNRKITLEEEIAKKEPNLANLKKDPNLAVFYEEQLLVINEAKKELVEIDENIILKIKAITAKTQERENISLDLEMESFIKIYKSKISDLNYTSQSDEIDDLRSAPNPNIFKGFIFHGTANCCLDHLSRNAKNWLSIKNDLDPIRYDFLSGGLNDFWGELRDVLLCPDSKPEKIIETLYNTFVDQNGNTVTDFLFIFKNITDEKGQSNQITRILEFWKDLIEKFNAYKPIANPRNYIYAFILDNNCSLIEKPHYKSSREDEYKKLISDSNLPPDSLSLLPVVVPMQPTDYTRWETRSGVPPNCKTHKDQMEKIILETRGFFLPTLKKVGDSKMAYGLKDQFLNFIKDTIEKPL